MNLNVIFKNVGLGDSIILEWIGDDNRKKTGIINCNLHEGTNPIKDYIIEYNIIEIEFIILSSPQYKNYSGFVDLFNYCIKEKIIIHKFLHTLSFTPSIVKQLNKNIEFSKILTSSEVQLNRKQKIAQLFTLLHNLHIDKNSILRGVYLISDLNKIVLNYNLTLNFLSPSLHETQIYLDKTIKSLLGRGLHKSSTNHDANLLSSIIQLESNTEQILFTLNATKYSLRRLLKNENTSLFDKKMILAQIPNHGAKKNHTSQFWEEFKNSNSTIIVASVDSNPYNYPHKEVLEYFTEKSLQVYTTGSVRSITKNINMLNLYESPFKKNEIRFSIQNGNVITTIR